MTHAKVSRRTVLKGLAAIPIVVATIGCSTTASAEALSLDDPLAEAMGYVEQSATQGQHCANCNLF